MAAGGYKEFIAGSVLEEDDINDFLMQGILVFADDTARNAAITSPVEGQFAFLKDSDTLTYHDGSDWVVFETGVPFAEVSGTTGSPGTATDGAATIYTYTGNGSITFSEPGQVRMLIVGGGGGSPGPTFADRSAGGAGAGGFHDRIILIPEAGAYTITVGAGGAIATVGGDSTFSLSGVDTFGQVAPGGGNGTIQGGLLFGRGGSGGGGGNDVVSQLNIATFGNVGGAGAVGAVNNRGGGGGGGASAAGAAGTTGTGGNGGAGLATTISGSSVTYAGGGGGGIRSGTPGTGGTGGGGAGGTVSGTAGSANTGGGAGGGGSDAGVTGGSGIFVLRVGG